LCGIAGGYGNLKKEIVYDMLNIQQYRGPDGLQVLDADDLILGHTRLAIVDPEGGKQPLSNESNDIWVVVNGEIYNFPYLYNKLKEKHEFKTRSDSEVVIHLFEEKGEKCFSSLDGMFSIALGTADGDLYLARDPIGIKPLYYGYDKDENLLFSSELKALIPHAKDVHEFPNGYYWKIGDTKTPVRFYHPTKPKKKIKNATSVITELDKLLNRAIKKRLMSDVPVGVFLSGGLDSSLIAALMRKHYKDELHSFSVGLEGSEDLKNARQMASVLNTVHHERILTKNDIISALPKVIKILESFDPALVRSSVPTYFISELASKYVKVVLSGEGADEIFAGYHYLDQFKTWNSLETEMWKITWNLHNTNLQRVDRMSMAHSIECRVPFLDLDLVDFAFKIHPSLKRKKYGKWILRKLAVKYLPKDIAWRKKEKFAVGTGIAQFLEMHANNIISDTELTRYKEKLGITFESKEEFLYWKLFERFYDKRQDILETIGHSRSLNPGELWRSAI